MFKRFNLSNTFVVLSRPMRSRTGRLVIGSVAWIAIAAAAFFIIQSDKQLTEPRAAVRVFDLNARRTTDALADLRVAEEAYVAEGQGAAFWMTKVSTVSAAVVDAIGSLRQTSRSDVARASLDEAAAAVAEFGNIDQRVRDYVRSGQRLMAGDVIFTEGVETAAAAGRHVEAARIAERQALETTEASLRRQHVLALGSGAGVTALVVLLLAAQRPEQRPSLTGSVLDLSAPASSDEPQSARDFQPAPTRAVAPALKDAAQLCTDFARVRNVNDLQMLAGRTASLMDASGVVVWLGSVTGADLRPVLAHGYAPQVVARMANVPRSDDNAAAAAYRTGELQIVLARPGSPSGAVVAPILSSDGCIGALSAEIRSGAETSDTVHALAVLIAAQLAAVLVASVPDEGEPRVAATS